VIDGPGDEKVLPLVSVKVDRVRSLGTDPGGDEQMLSDISEAAAEILDVRDDGRRGKSGGTTDGVVDRKGDPT
jgi:hypothetical protein